jgi:uncharacterized SAM-binding protein YcdF (DUF218 family)
MGLLTHDTVLSEGDGHMNPCLWRQVSLFLITASVVCLGTWSVATLELFHEADATTLGDPTRADVIVVLAGDADRATYGAFLARQGVAARVVSTLLDPRCVELNRASPACRTGVRNTVDEAHLMRCVLLQQRARDIIIVTSRYHAARAAAVFAIVFAGSGVRWRVVAPPRATTVMDELRLAEMVKIPVSLGLAFVARVAPDLYELALPSQQIRCV